MIQLNYRDSRPIYEQVKDGLRQLIINGVLTEGSRLPSVRELAVSLTIFTCEITIKIIVKAIAGDIKLSPATARKATIDLKKAVLFETTPNATAKKVARAACYLS